MPNEFKQLVDGIREIEPAIGTPVKKMSRIEKMNREILAKCIVADKFISDGTVITRDLLTTRSPAKGLSPQRMDEIVGTTACRDIFAGEPLTEDDLRGNTIIQEFDGSTVPWQWGPIVRFHEFKNYLKYNPQLFEFHLSDKDLDEPIPQGNFSQQLVVHAPEYMHRTYLNPSAAETSQRTIAIKTLQRSLDVTRQLAPSFQGTPKFIIHPGGITLKASANPNKFLDLFADTLSQLNADGIDILPENLPPRPWVFGGEWVTNIWLLAPEIKKFLDETNLKMCFDTSHAALACNAAGADLAEQVKILQPYIRHLHLSDGAGIGEEGLQIGEGTINWDQVLKPLKGYRHTMVPEIWQGHLHGGRGFFQALEHLKPYMK